MSPLTHPSFPTRRSSDLYDERPHEEEMELYALSEAEGNAECVVEPGGKKGEQLVAGGTYRIYRICPVDEDAAPDQDRKSTRLNSSHTVSSYAVFCLKEKKDYVWRREAHRRTDSNRRVNQYALAPPHP